MNVCNKCLKVGNPIVEALGAGIQTVMIRTYKPSPVGKQFVLFPTSFYKNLKTDYVFKDEFLDFVNNNIIPYNEDSMTEIKYYATVEYVIEDKNIPLSYLNDFHVWTDMHVYDYLGEKPIFIWLLRVYKLKKPVFRGNAKGNVYANLKEGISLDGIKPVISDDEFKEIKEKFVFVEYNKLLNDKLDKILDNQEKYMK